jgi:hypothetical protein
MEFSDVLLESNEAAAFLKVSLSWLAKARMRGDGPAYVKGRPIHPLRGDRVDPVDEVAPAPVDERAVVAAGVGRGEGVLRGDRFGVGIMVHLNTLVYIKRNEVELRLGTNITVYARDIYLIYS